MNMKVGVQVRIYRARRPVVLNEGAIVAVAVGDFGGGVRARVHRIAFRVLGVEGEGAAKGGERGMGSSGKWIEQVVVVVDVVCMIGVAFQCAT